MPKLGAYRFDESGLRKGTGALLAWSALTAMAVTVRKSGPGMMYFLGFTFRESGPVWLPVPRDIWGRPPLDAMGALLRVAAKAAPPEVVIERRIRHIMEWSERAALDQPGYRATTVKETSADRLVSAANWRWVRLDYDQAVRLAQAATTRRANAVAPWRLLLAIETERGAAPARLASLREEVVKRSADGGEPGRPASPADLVPLTASRALWVILAAAACWVITVVWVGTRVYDFLTLNPRRIGYEAPTRDLAFEDLKSRAGKGDVDAMMRVSLYYSVGIGREKNPEEAYAWKLRAAEKGHVPAMDDVGSALINGRGVTKDVPTGETWLRQAAEKGSAGAAYHLGGLYYYGRDRPRDYDASFGWYQLALERGYKLARSPLAYHHERGLGTPQDFSAAYPIYLQLAEEGNAHAANKIGVMYARGDGVTRDPVQAIKWYRIAAEKGSAVAQSNLGLALMAGRGVERDEAEAVQWFEKAAAQKNPTAIRNLANALTSGRGVPKDPARAAELMKSAAVNDSAADLAYAMMLFQGQGMAKDEAAALERLEALATKGYEPARSKLAQLKLGLGTPEELARARASFRALAENGSVTDRTRHGIMCLEGIGGAQDLTTAVSALTAASDGGDWWASLVLAGVLTGYRNPGATPNHEEAKRLLRLASDKGGTLAKSYLTRVEAGGDLATLLDGRANTVTLPLTPPPALKLEPAKGLPDAQPRAIFQARPQYPFTMRYLGLSGEVVVDFIITPRGDVSGAYALRSSHPVFEAAAVESVARWRFKPGVKDGRYVPTHMQVPIMFTMNEQ